jgi:DNA polymerase/3'-5' exonuclease PolX
MEIFGLMGIHSAARKKVEKPPRLIIETIIVKGIADKIKAVFPQIIRLHLVGSRLRHRDARDVEFVAVTPSLTDMPGRSLVNIFDRPADKEIKSGKVYPPKVDLFFSLPEEVEAHIIELGLGLDNIRWKKAAKKKGYKLTRYGLFKGSVLVAQKMAQIAHLIGMPLKPHLVMSLENPL